MKAVQLKLSLSFITGPYTLSALFAYKNEKTFLNLGRVLAEIVKENIFENKYGKVFMVTLDELALGVMSDPTIDYGTPDSSQLSAKGSWRSKTILAISNEYY